MKAYVVSAIGLLVWVLQSTVLVAQKTDNSGILWSTDWSPNNKYIAVGGNTDTLKVFNTKEYQLIKAYPVKRTITCVKFHPYRNMLAVTTQLSSDNSFIINLDTGKKIELQGISADGARGLDWSLTGEYLLVGDNDGVITIFNLDGKIIRQIEQENSKSITSLSCHPHKNTFVTVGDKIRIYSFAGTLLNTIVSRPEAENLLILCVTWHKSGKFFVTGDYGDLGKKHPPVLQFWSEAGELIRTISKSDTEIRNLRWSNKGNKLAVTSDCLRIHDEEGNLLFTGYSLDPLWSVAWNNNGSRIVTTDRERNISIWNNLAEFNRSISN